MYMHSELHQRHQLWTSLKTECFNFWPYYLDLWPLMSPSMSVMRVIVPYP